MSRPQRFGLRDNRRYYRYMSLACRTSRALTVGRRHRRKQIDTGRYSMRRWMGRIQRRIGTDRLKVSSGPLHMCKYSLSGSQHVVSPFWPGSHCSPASTMPSVRQSCTLCHVAYSLPHCCKLIVDLSPGFTTQLDETSLAPRPEQMFPSVHWENVSSVSDVVGFMMNLPPASHVFAFKGQHRPESEQPAAQSWIAPKLTSAPMRPR